jgi:septal ring factor EnvC (AmiA/AmiB activator)
MTAADKTPRTDPFRKPILVHVDDEMGGLVFAATEGTYNKILSSHEKLETELAAKTREVEELISNREHFAESFMALNERAAQAERELEVKETTISLANVQISMLERELAEAKAEAERLRDNVCQLIDHCPDAECGTCGMAACPYGEPLHFHHDGCPACYAARAQGGERG